ncbi:MAG: putative transporter [Paludibacteraceae bacterium]|nr:putative transporter [Paludibacteraceae bacterium]
MISELFGGTGLSSTLIYLCLTASAGMYIGKLGYKGVKLGIAGVLFMGILLAHLKGVAGYEPLDGNILHFVKEFGLILFIYAIGIDVGPRFVSSFKNDGLTMNLFATAICILGTVIALLFHLIGGVDLSVITGVLCGAVTNTPGLGAAQQALSDNKEAVEQAGMAYAVAYPFGVIGIILTMLLVRALFKIKIDEEVTDYNNKLDANNRQKLESVEVTVSNSNLFGQKISYIKSFVENELAISRIQRGDNFILASENEELQAGDIIYGVSSTEHIDKLKMKIGPVSIGQKKAVSGSLAMFNVLVTNRKIAGKTIEQIGIYRRYEANITRVFRAGMEILPSRNTIIELGDTLRVVGKRDLLTDIQKEIGNSTKELAKPNTIPIFLGILLGIILGSIKIDIPGLPAAAKLGLAGGPLIISLLLGHLGRIGKLDFYMSPGANMMLRELGIILFLACVGLSSGTNFVNTIANGGYQWMLYGAAITFIPILIVAIVARLMKFNYLKICGIISGGMTDPPALEYANSLASTQAQSTAYVAVYPLTMFLRVMLAQILVLAFL